MVETIKYTREHWKKERLIKQVNKWKGEKSQNEQKNDYHKYIVLIKINELKLIE